MNYSKYLNPVDFKVKKLSIFYLSILILIMFIFCNCATTPDSGKENDAGIGSYRYKAISLLENVFYSYENQNYGDLNKSFGNDLADRFSIIKDSIRNEFKKYDLIKITFNIEKVEKVNNLLLVHFNWTKDRRDISSGSFSEQTNGKSIFTFYLDSGKLKQITGDYIFGLGGK